MSSRRTTSRRTRMLAATAALAMSLAACGAEAGPADDAGASAAPAAAATDATDAEDTTAAVLASVATAPDGSTFTVGDFAGQQVLVETFATWCSTCRRQLNDTQAAAVAAGDDAVFLVLSVETTIDPAALAEYADRYEFGDVQFGVLDAEGLAAFEAAFGRSVLNPPSTPKFRIDPDGQLSELTTGLESSEEILASLAAA